MIMRNYCGPQTLSAALDDFKCCEARGLLLFLAQVVTGSSLWRTTRKKGNCEPFRHETGVDPALTSISELNIEALGFLPMIRCTSLSQRCMPKEPDCVHDRNAG